MLGYRFHVSCLIRSSFTAHCQTRKPKSVFIDVLGHDEEYEILNVCEFNSTRKRMSVIVRGPDKRIKLYTKGADTVIYERLAPNQTFQEPTLAHLEVSNTLWMLPKLIRRTTRQKVFELYV